MPIAEACLLKFPVPGEKKVVVSQRFPLDNMGSFDDAVCESPVVWWDTNKMKYGMVYTGYKYITGTQNYDAGQIGLAWSDDLIHWTKDENSPILSGSGIEGAPDRGSVTGPVMLMIGDTYYLYYIGCSQPGYEQGDKTLCLATGNDIYNLERYSGNPVVPVNKQAGSPRQNIYHANIYIGETENYMFVNCAGVRPSDQFDSENILLFKSNNMTEWVYDSVVVEGGTDEDDPDYRICGDPCVFDIGDNNFYMTTYQVPKSWTGTKVGLAYTSKKNFPHGWVKLPYQLPTQPNNAKAFIMYRKGEIYVFTSGNVIQLYTEFEIT